MEAMQSTMRSKAGIELNLSEEAPADVEATGFDECTQAKPCDDWEIASFGYFFTWVYGPDFLPTGEELFSTGAAANAGDYSDAANNSNITTTTTAASHSAETTALFKYQDYLAKQLPVVWMPNEYYQLTMYKSDLAGVVPQSVEDEIYPQYFSVRGK
jgi:peptide/nickel transport system substrate-binding protein